MPIAAAITGIAGAVGSLGSAWMQSNASQKASQQQVALGEQALAQQEQMWQQAYNAATPVISSGYNLLGAGEGVIKNVLGLPYSTLKSLLTPGPSMTATLSQIPGFKFAQDWGQKAVQNLGTTTGLGGNVLKAGADYATGVAQQGWGSIANALQSMITGVGNIGLGETNTGANMVVQPTTALMGGAIQSGNSMANTLTGIGQSQAAGTLGSANALSSGFTGAGNSLTTAMLLSKLFGGGSPGGSGGGMYS